MMSIIAATLTAGFLFATTSLASAGTVVVKSKTVEYKMGNETFAGLFVYPQTSKEPGSCIPGGG
jgi:membrane-associated PAP2 superfamily phosphatase